MVRRHRLREEEVGYVMKAVHLRLGELIDIEFTEETETLFRVLWRFTRHRKGPPAYPETTYEEITALLHDTMELRLL